MRCIEAAGGEAERAERTPLPTRQVADCELYRAKPGEILTHRSHPGSPIHAETNPCPAGRCLYVLDWADVRNVVYREGALSHRCDVAAVSPHHVTAASPPRNRHVTAA